ncbi:11562_t:CDS:2 [Ambispora gerdemannii]|uniref:11562_t:CDS:1 n=1 Tax=Ambispora gerdemannii TaxID=144530 RepID=A0A9N8V8B0_9GLOM|nr:11562_t:CDS:2 [Ambispora gerdemannii]
MKYENMEPFSSSVKARREIYAKSFSVFWVFSDIIFFSLEEALSCILSPITYSPDATSSTSATETYGNLPTKTEFNEFNDVINEDVRNAMHVNICLILNKLTGPHYNYSRRDTSTPVLILFTGSKLQYCVLSTYDTTARQANDDPNSRNPLIISVVNEALQQSKDANPGAENNNIRSRVSSSL